MNADAPVVRPVIQSEWYFTAADGVVGAACSGTPYSEQPPLKADSPLHDTTICILVMEGGAVFMGAARGGPPDIDRQQAKIGALNKIPQG